MEWIIQKANWIPVDNGLPNHDGWVLVYIRREGAAIGRIQGGIKRWIVRVDNGLKYSKDSYYNVTHWMPLPEPPQL